MPDSLLLPGEILLFSTRRHLLWLLVPLALILIAAFLLATRACSTGELRLDDRCPVLVAVGVASAALPFLLEWRTTHFGLTNYRLFRLQAPVWLRSRQLDLAAIQSLSAQQSLLGRLFGFGDVFVDTAARRGGRIVLDYVPDPLRLRDAIAEAHWQSREGWA